MTQCISKYGSCVVTCTMVAIPHAKDSSLLLLLYPDNIIHVNGNMCRFQIIFRIIVSRLAWGNMYFMEKNTQTAQNCWMGGGAF